MPQTFDIVDGFGFNILRKLGHYGIATTSKHKILPYQNSKLVASIIKSVILVDTSSPHTYHILVALSCQLD